MSHECKPTFIECATHTDILVCLFAICAHTKMQDERDLSCQVVKLSGYCQAVRLSGCQVVSLSGCQGAVRCGLTGLTAVRASSQLDTVKLSSCQVCQVLSGLSGHCQVDTVRLSGPGLKSREAGRPRGHFFLQNYNLH